jgi:AcrR family transcriptional regulator
MNKSTPDRRIQRTRQLLLNSLLDLILEKGYEMITVQEIIDRVNIGRSTFYFHFRDKEELLFSGFENLRETYEDFYKRLSPEQTGWDFSFTLFQHAEQNRLMFKALFAKQVGDNLLRHIEKNLSMLLTEHFRSIWDEKKQTIPLEVFVTFFISTFLGLLIWWLDHGLPYPAERMNDMFKQLTKPSFEAVFNKQL